MDSARWLAGYEDMLARTAAGAAAASQALRDVGGHATSSSGEVTVTVGAGGVLDDVALTPAARDLDTDELARLIVATARQAHQHAAAQVAVIMADYLGNGPALAHVTSHLPPAAPS